jgi:NTP pyrophosphatase (non-canonical NTP hydrolase)
MVDNKTKISELKSLVQTFCEARDWDQFHDPKELAIGVVTEASELLDIFRFKSKEQMASLLTDPIRRNDIEEELADTLFFILRFAQMYNVDLSDVILKKIKKNEKKYPLDLAKGSNKKYTEY